jgi:hypothetical protein
MQTPKKIPAYAEMFMTRVEQKKSNLFVNFLCENARWSKSIKGFV